MGKGEKISGAGRKAGIPNRLTMDIKQAIMEAFEKLGGADYLVKVGKKDPKIFFTLLAKIVPQQTKPEVKQEPTLADILSEAREEEERER